MELADVYGQLDTNDITALAHSVTADVKRWADRPALAEALAKLGTGRFPLNLGSLDDVELDLMMAAVHVHAGRITWHDLGVDELMPVEDLPSRYSRGLRDLFHLTSVELAAERDRRIADERALDVLEERTAGIYTDEPPEHP